MKRSQKFRVGTLIIPIAFVFAGCGAQQTSAQSAAQQGTGTGAPGAVKGVAQPGAAPGVAATSAASNAIQTQAVTDPMLDNMTAFTVHFPAKWHFEGAIFQGDDCLGNPYPVMRATSPDGLSFVETLPEMGWRWVVGPTYGKQQQNSCLPLSGPMSAQDFLKYLAGTMKVDSVVDEPVPAERLAKLRQNTEALAKQYPGMKQTHELARAIVHYRNGTFAMEGRLGASVICNEQVLPGIRGLTPYRPGQPVQMTQGPSTTFYKCSADVDYMTGPESQFAALTQQWESPAMAAKPEPAWYAAVNQRFARNAQAIADADTERTRRVMQAQQQEFNRQQAVQQQMHNEFLATLQRGTNMSMQRTQESMYARSTAASDWVDYALDQKTVMDPNTGQLNKVSSSYSYTWVDNTGKVGYQTNWADANPNGVLPGTWTQQRVVHGNGAP